MFHITFISIIATYGVLVAQQTFNDVRNSDFSSSQLTVPRAFCGTPTESTELAGKPLVDFPYVQAVRSFNHDETVWIAIDPARHPNLVGENVDLYIVVARTDEEWIADPSLIDVRVGGPQSVMISGTSIQANTFVAADPDQLNADAGVGLGVGYDVVVDSDLDGLLGPNDLLDGAGDAVGFYVVHDTTQQGPLTVLTADYDAGDYGTPGPFQLQRVYYPETIAALDPAPLIVVSHGWTYEWDFYDYIGQHLASYGYVVMSHENNVGWGDPAATHSASLTTISNTDAFLGALDQIAGGVLAGNVDTNRIVWIGHSTGAEGIVRAYTRIATGGTTPNNFTAGDIALLCPMCPVSWLSAAYADPADANLHSFIGGADTDTSGAPNDSFTQPIAVFERGTGNKSLTYVHGAGHGYFHDEGQGGAYAEGPDLIGWSKTHDVVRGYLLPLVERFTRDNPAALDFSTRLFDNFHPSGIDPTVVVVTEYRDAASVAKFVVDDFQTNGGLYTSSSGGLVTFGVANVSENLMRDVDGSFDWTGLQPQNGMTRARYDDDPQCVLFDWTPNASAFYELEIIESERDFSDDEWISFRACQGTRHPLTDSPLNTGPLSFTVTLRDVCGVTSSIDFGVFGSIPKPYQRTGAGSGAGWQNEFATVRIRLDSFTTNGTELNLCNIEAIRFEFGAEYGSPRGRIGLDDIEIIEGEGSTSGSAGCCLGDLDNDNDIGVSDVLLVIDLWGTSDSLADINGDGIVNVSDLLLVVGNWGPCE